MTEIFKDIIGYETLYQISNLGRVKSLPKGDGNGNKERILVPEHVKKNNTTYYRISLSKDGVVQRFQIHRLVAEAFIPNLESKPYVNHIDNNGENNSVLNLEWCTHSENMLHAQKQGRLLQSQKQAGLQAGIASKHRQDAVHNSRVGNKYGELIVLEYYTDVTKIKPRTVYICKCTCGNTVEKVPYNLFNPNRLQMCNECSYKYRSLKGKDIVSTV